MKKPSFILIILLILQFFSFAPQAFADSTNGTTISGANINAGSATMTRKDGWIQVSVSGQLTGSPDDASGTLTGIGLYKKWNNSLVIHYQRLTAVADLPTLTQAWWSAPDENSCTVNGDYTFTCATDVGALANNLTYGAYAFQVGTENGLLWKNWTAFDSPLSFNVVAPDVQGTTNNVTLNPPQVMGGNSIQVSGTFSPDLVSTMSGQTFELRWGTQKNLPSDPERIADLTNTIPLTALIGSTGNINTSTGAFTVTIPNLPSNMYAFGIWSKSPVGARYDKVLSSFMDEISVTGQSNQNAYTLKDPVSTGQTTGSGPSTTGYWASPEVDITQPSAGDYRLELGTATPVSSGDVHYNCLLSDTDTGKIGSVNTVPANTPSAQITNPATFTGLQAGLYCVGMKYLAPASVGANAAGLNLPANQVVVNPPSGLYFTTTSAGNTGIFSVGGVAVPPGATLDATANGNGCTSTGDNATYCLLAPLPGVGDSSGKLDVTKGIGDYINTIIKLVFGLIGVLSVLMIVIGGIEYMSTVSIGEKEGAKERITSALFGLLVALASYIILYTINPNLVNLSVTVQNSPIKTQTK